MHQVVLLIGGNMGDREQLIHLARGLLAETGRIKQVSAIYETQAWGNASEGKYLNQALIIETRESPRVFIQMTQKIENLLGRTRSHQWGNRTMDIDIIYYNGEIYRDDSLIIPHPLMSERRFVLVPLVEIMPDYVHPVFQISNQQLLIRCTDESEVSVYRKEN